MQIRCPPFKQKIHCLWEKATHHEPKIKNKQTKPNRIAYLWYHPIQLASVSQPWSLGGLLFLGRLQTSAHCPWLCSSLCLLCRLWPPCWAWPPRTQLLPIALGYFVWENALLQSTQREAKHWLFNLHCFSMNLKKLPSAGSVEAKWLRQNNQNRIK